MNIQVTLNSKTKTNFSFKNPNKFSDLLIKQTQPQSETISLRLTPDIARHSRKERYEDNFLLK